MDWEKSDEGQKDAAWHKHKKQEFRKEIQEACAQNGIKYLVMNEAESWDTLFGALDGVEVIDVKDPDKLRQKMNSARAMTPSVQDKGEIPGVEVREW